MTRMHLTAAALLSMLGTASADPCTMVDKDQATWAVKHITSSQTVLRWCESCGETTPGPMKQREARAIANKTGAWHVLVGGKGADLAMLYVQTGPKTFANVGGLVGCAVTTPFTALPIAAPPPSSCPPPSLLGTCAQGKPAPVRDSITGCVREYVCPPP